MLQLDLAAFENFALHTPAVHKTATEVPLLLHSCDRDTRPITDRGSPSLCPSDVLLFPPLVDVSDTFQIFFYFRGE